MATANRYDLSRDYARLMLIMRRLVREEFSVTIHLDAPDAGEELLAFAGQSQNSMLKEMAVELELMLREMDGLAEDSASKPESGEDVAYYRGAPVKKAAGSDLSDADSPQGPTRIYRGQKVAK